jgi:hypothetical protein
MPRRDIWLVIARLRASGAPGLEAPAIETMRGVDRAHGTPNLRTEQKRVQSVQDHNRRQEGLQVDASSRQKMSGRSINSVSCLMRWQGPLK